MLFLWIILYGLLYCLSEAAAPMLNAAAWLTPITMVIYIGLLLLWVCRTGQQQAAGLVFFRLRKGDLPVFLPLMVLPLCNLVTTGNPAISLFSMLLTLCTCTAEELFFRGFLLSFLRKKVGLQSVLIAALTFSLFHSVNIFSGWDIPSVLMQMLLAFSAGIYYCLIRISCGSLIPCIAAHFLTNLTAGSLITIRFSESMIIWGLCTGLLLICSLLLFSKTAAKATQP